MIKIAVELNTAGLLSGIQATGHSEAAAKGQDIVCASVSVLLRTLARTLESKDGVLVKGSADMRGEISLDIKVDSDALSDWLRGVTSYSLTGLKDLEAEYPQNCSVSIHKEMKE